MTVIFPRSLLVFCVLWSCGFATLSFQNIATDSNRVPPNTNVRRLDPDLYGAWLNWTQNVPSAGVPAAPPAARYTLPDGNKKGGTVDTHAGISIFDFNDDGLDDIYVPDARGHKNRLYLNKFTKRRGIKFVDVATSKGVAEIGSDSTGSCVADIDNDGDLDLVVLGNVDPPRLYRNRGWRYGYSFAPAVTLMPKLPRHGWTSCTFADVNGDGYNDLIVSCGWNPVDFIECTDPITNNKSANVLFMNYWGWKFVDESLSRGYGEGNNDVYITWSVLPMDYDQDGDIDLIEWNDQCGFVDFSPFPRRGDIRVHQNNGNGFFTEVTRQVGTAAFQFAQNAWMGGCAADFNNDGLLDMFGTNFGHFLPEYILSRVPPFNGPPFTGLGLPPVFRLPSRVLFGTLTNGVHGFFDPWNDSRPDPPNFPWLPADPTFKPFADGIGSVFGFGTVCTDLDNDGNTDIAYFGNALLLRIAAQDNPGVVMLGDGAGHFTFNSALHDDFPSQLRGVKGAAFGDFNNDGKADIVSVSGYTVTQTTIDAIDAVGIPRENTTEFPGIALNSSQFAQPLQFWDFGVEFVPGTFQWPVAFPQNVGQGDLAIQINTAQNSNNWIRIRLRGTVLSTTPRDGIGATITVYPCERKLSDCQFGPSVKRQMLVYGPGGSTMSSNTFTRPIGIGQKRAALVVVKWSNAGVNGFFVRAGTTKTLPQFNCDAGKNSPFLKKKDFRKCLWKERRRLKHLAWVNYEDYYYDVVAHSSPYIRSNIKTWEMRHLLAATKTKTSSPSSEKFVRHVIGIAVMIAMIIQ